MFALHFLAILLISLIPGNSHKKLTDFMSTADGLRRLILEGDVLAAEDLLFQILGQKTGIKEKSQLESLIPGGIAALLPAFSAITLADRLLADGPEERRKNSTRFVQDGHFRKFGVTGKVAPALLAASLAWMESDAGAEEMLADQVKKERKRLSRETEKLLRPLLKKEN